MDMSSLERLMAQKLADPAVRAGFGDAARRRRVVEELVGAREGQGPLDEVELAMVGVVRALTDSIDRHAEVESDPVEFCKPKPDLDEVELASFDDPVRAALEGVD